MGGASSSSSTLLNALQSPVHLGGNPAQPLLAGRSCHRISRSP